MTVFQYWRLLNGFPINDRVRLTLNFFKELYSYSKNSYILPLTLILTIIVIIKIVKFISSLLCVLFLVNFALSA